MLVKLGGHIRQLRREKGYSQEGFAAAAGIDRSYMGAIERGERNITSHYWIRIAKTLEVSRIGDLFPPDILEYKRWVVILQLRHIVWLSNGHIP